MVCECVCNGGVTPDSKELPIGHEILKKTYVVGGVGCSAVEGPREKTAELGGGQWIGDQ